MTRVAPTSAGCLRPPDPVAGGEIEQWMLDPRIDFLNHGCFGARPRLVSTHQADLRAAFEARPVEWLDRSGEAAVEAAKAAVGRAFGMRPADFGFVTNATGGVNAVVRSLRFEPGDEVLTTTHVYNAVRQTMRCLVETRGAVYRELHIGLPLAGPGPIVEAFAEAITDRTKLIVIDHVTSPTGLRFPIDAVIALANARGAEVLVDGAHAPGMLSLDVASLGAAYYTGNLHKWVSAPVGAAFLWVDAERQADIHPTTISHNFTEGLAREFLWQGTRDITPWLASATAIDFMTTLGWDRVRAHNHALVTWAQQELCRAWGVEPASPPDGSMLGSLATIPLPGGFIERHETPEALQSVLYDVHSIEVPVIPWDDAWWIRVSAHVHNRPAQYERLAEAILAIRGRNR
ncbi:MAG: aminotransferase class V-fold PLP-dependent enzyme [Planctomycetota bacterium]|jgi:isopenicillin-N epimerase